VRLRACLAAIEETITSETSSSRSTTRRQALAVYGSRTSARSREEVAGRHAHLVVVALRPKTTVIPLLVPVLSYVHSHVSLGTRTYRRRLIHVCAPGCSQSELWNTIAAASLTAVRTACLCAWVDIVQNFNASRQRARRGDRDAGCVGGMLMSLLYVTYASVWVYADAGRQRYALRLTWTRDRLIGRVQVVHLEVTGGVRGDVQRERLAAAVVGRQDLLLMRSLRRVRPDSALVAAAEAAV